MNNLNSILIEGNLTKDPEIHVTQNGRSLCKFPIANNRYYKNKEQEVVQETSFIQVETWGPLAESCGTYLEKGKKVRVVGRLRQDRWQTEDSQNKERFLIVAEHVEFQSRPDKEGSEDDSE
ncbi:MAG: single-stranded DNA-binding protein [Sphaerochaetaceae bacterium]|nr:single-stranded DNA-binding protein [Sphaerochaetaceae bacterium]